MTDRMMERTRRSWENSEVSVQINELIEKAQILVDSTGKKKAILLDYAFWEELLEDLEDMEALDRSREANREYVSWEQAKAELQADGIDV